MGRHMAWILSTGLNLGRDSELARTLAWGEGENLWHSRHGTRPDPAR